MKREKENDGVWSDNVGFFFNVAKISTYLLRVEHFYKTLPFVLIASVPRVGDGGWLGGVACE
jgi:hypothetical protein